MYAIHTDDEGERHFEYRRLSSSREQVVDTTGAGDAFAGGYLAGRLAGREPESAAALGNAMAAVPGAITPRGMQLVPEPLPADQPTALTDHA